MRDAGWGNKRFSFRDNFREVLRAVAFGSAEKATFKDLAGTDERRKNAGDY